MQMCSLWSSPDISILPGIKIIILLLKHFAFNKEKGRKHFYFSLSLANLSSHLPWQQDALEYSNRGHLENQSHLHQMRMTISSNYEHRWKFVYLRLIEREIWIQCSFWCFQPLVHRNDHSILTIIKIVYDWTQILLH